MNMRKDFGAGNVTEEEYKATIESYGWTEQEIALRLAEYTADSNYCGLPLPFEIYLREKGAQRIYYVDDTGLLYDTEADE